MSADLAAIEDAKSVGIDPAATYAFAKNKVGTRSMWSTLSRTTSGYRAAPRRKIGFAREKEQLDDSKNKKKS